MLTKRKDRQASRTHLQTLTGGMAAAPLDRRTFLRRSGLVAGGLAALGSFQLGTVKKAAAISPPATGRANRTQEEHLYPLFGRMHRNGRGPERRVDGPGTFLGQPLQSRLALRQRRQRT